MALYDDSPFPVRPAIAAAHTPQIEAMTAPGTWWSGAQRRRLALAARQARVEAGVQEASPQPAAGDDAEVPDAALAVVRRVAVDGRGIERSLLDDALAAGLTDAEYVETVGIAARMANFDIFARGLGVSSSPLPPAADGEPSRQRSERVMDEGAWVSTLPSGRRGAGEADTLYGKGVMAPFIYRGLSLVPAEAASLIALGTAQYLPIAEFMNLDFSYDPALSRAQVELVAARTSVVNECFY